MDDLVEKLLETIKEKDNEIKRLTDILLSRAGYLDRPSTYNEDPNTPSKVRTGRLSWSDVKERLEGMTRNKNMPDWKAEAEKAHEELLDLNSKEMEN